MDLVFFFPPAEKVPRAASLNTFRQRNADLGHFRLFFLFIEAAFCPAGHGCCRNCSCSVFKSFPRMFFLCPGLLSSLCCFVPGSRRCSSLHNLHFQAGFVLLNIQSSHTALQAQPGSTGRITATTKLQIPGDPNPCALGHCASRHSSPTSPTLWR